MGYNSVSAFQVVRMRGTRQQTNVGLLYLPPSVRLHAPGNTATALIEGLAVGYASVQNRSGSTGATGVAGRLPNRLWIAGQYTAGAFVDDTAAAQSTTANDFDLESTTNDSGFIIASPVKFGAVSINVGTASNGGAAVRAVSYSDAAGSGWTSATNLLIQDGATGNLATGERLLVWEPWTDWGVTQATGLEDVPGGLYAIRVQATTAPTVTAAVASAMEVFLVALGTEGIADNGLWEWSPALGELRFPQSDGLVAIFETADPGNRATVHVKTA